MNWVLKENRITIFLLFLLVILWGLFQLINTPAEWLKNKIFLYSFKILAMIFLGVPSFAFGFIIKDWIIESREKLFHQFRNESLPDDNTKNIAFYLAIIVLFFAILSIMYVLSNTTEVTLTVSSFISGKSEINIFDSAFWTIILWSLVGFLVNK